MKKTFRIGLRISAAALAALFCFQTVPAYALADPDYETAERSDEGSTVSPEATGLQAGILYEDVSLRNEYTKHFKMSGGMYTAVQYNRPVHYMDKSDGTWSDIKNVFSYKPGGTDGFSCEYTNEDAKPGAALSDNTGGALLKLSGDSEFPFTVSSARFRQRLSVPRTIFLLRRRMRAPRRKTEK